MEDRRSIKVLEICEKFTNKEIPCAMCPLQKPCAPILQDSKEAYDNRMNAAAEELK